MNITSRDAEKEIKIAEEKVKDSKLGVRELVIVAIKLATVAIKIALSVRGNTKRLMDKAGIKPAKLRKQSDKVENKSKESGN